MRATKVPSFGKVRDSAKANLGFNAEAEEYTDMISAGILDPAKVTRDSTPERCLHRLADAYN
jgi:chaperonin GroEL (HSP60 family)